MCVDWSIIVCMSEYVFTKKKKQQQLKTKNKKLND